MAMSSKHDSLQDSKDIIAFLQQENMELKKSYQELSKENQALKKVLKDDFQSNYRYIKKDYWRCMLRFLWDDE